MAKQYHIAFVKRIATVILLVTLSSSACSLRFYLHDRERRCFKFDAPYNSRVIGDRSIANGPGTAELSLQIKASDGNIVYESHISEPKDTKFAFNTPDYSPSHADPMDLDDYEYDDYEGDASYHACVTLSLDATTHRGGKRAVLFWIRPASSIRTRASDKHASEQTMGTVNKALADMHDVLQKMITDLTTLQQREKRLVRRSNSTGRRLNILAIAALFVMVCTASMQFLFFKTFFKSKKLM